MTTGEKICKLRKENNYTQEQLAELLSVSRQSISKYESGLAYPEMEKLIRLGELFHCSMDYLLKDEYKEDPMRNQQVGDEKETSGISDAIFFAEARRRFRIGRKSKRTIFGMPLWHIGKNAKGFIAVGFRAKGVISVGLFSTGILSIGVISMGLLSLGTISIGLLAAGAIAAGLMSTGAISVGLVACGAVAVGQVSIGAAAIGQYVAYGDYAKGMFAFGGKTAIGTVFEKAGDLSPEEIKQAASLMKEQVPAYYQWFVNWVISIL